MAPEDNTCTSCFQNTKYECIHVDCNLPLCHRCSIEEIKESTPDWLAMKQARAEDKKCLQAIPTFSSTSSTGKSKTRIVNTNRGDKRHCKPCFIMTVPSKGRSVDVLFQSVVAYTAISAAVV